MGNDQSKVNTWDSYPAQGTAYKEDRDRRGDQQQGRKKSRKEHTGASRGKAEEHHDPSSRRTHRRSRHSSRRHTTFPQHAGTKSPRVGDGMAPPVLPYQALPSTEETISRRKGDEITSREPQHCRELIRKMHGLNFGVWKGRNGFEADSGQLRDTHRRAMAAQAEINDIIREWIEQQGTWSEDEWKLVKDIEDLMSGVQVVQRPV